MTLARVLGHVRLFGHEFDLPGWRMAVVQVLLATLDVAVTASIFYALLPDSSGLTWLKFLGVYVASYTAGLAANLPGGIGVFDTAMLLGLSPWLDPPQILGAIVVFRLLYYIIPLFLAGSLFAGNELLLRGGALVRRRATGVGPAPPQTGWTEPDFAVATVTGTVALCGTLLLGVGLLAQPFANVSWADPDFVGVATSAAGHVMPSLIGAGLLVLSIGLSQRVNLAWILTILMLVAGGFFTVIEGRWPWVAGVLVFATMLVAPFKSFFYRHARLFSGPFDLGTAVPLFALVCCVLALTAFEQHVRFLADNSWWGIAFSSELPNRVRFTIGLAVLLGLFAIYRLIRPGGSCTCPGQKRPRSACARWRQLCRCAPTASFWARRRGPRSRSCAAATCCSGLAIRSGSIAIKFQRSGACETSRGKRGSIRRSGAPGRDS